MSVAVFKLALRPTKGKALIWNGSAFEPGTLAGTAMSGFTDNRIPFGSSAGGLEDSSSLTWNGTTFAVTGATTVTKSVSSASTEYGSQISLTQSGSGIAYGFEPYTIAAGTGAAASAACIYAKVATTAGDRDHIVAVQTQSTHNSTGTLTDLIGASVFLITDAASGAVTNLKGVEVNAPTISGGAPTNLYGIYVEAMSGATNNYSIYTNAGTARFGGDVHIASGFGLYIASDVRIAGTGTVTNFYSGSTNLGFYSQDGLSQWLGVANATGNVSITSTTASTSTVTGALQVAGGVGIAGQITFNGNTGLSLRVTNGVTNAAVATTLGSVGPTGSTAGDPQGWLRISVAGTDRYIPFW